MWPLSSRIWLKNTSFLLFLRLWRPGRSKVFFCHLFSATLCGVCAKHIQIEIKIKIRCRILGNEIYLLLIRSTGFKHRLPVSRGQLSTWARHQFNKKAQTLQNSRIIFCCTPLGAGLSAEKCMWIGSRSFGREMTAAVVHNAVAWKRCVINMKI